MKKNNYSEMMIVNEVENKIISIAEKNNVQPYVWHNCIIKSAPEIDGNVFVLLHCKNKTIGSVFYGTNPNDALVNKEGFIITLEDN